MPENGGSDWNGSAHDNEAPDGDSVSDKKTLQEIAKEIADRVYRFDNDYGFGFDNKDLSFDEVIRLVIFAGIKAGAEIGYEGALFEIAIDIPNFAKTDFETWWAEISEEGRE